MPNLGSVMRAFDTLVMLRDLAKRFTGETGTPPPTALDQTAPPQALRPGGALEATLTNVVVAALKEAFDRDHARLELERQQIEEQRRRAEEALRAEQQRQAMEREIAHLRLLAGMSLFGWIASVVMFAFRSDASLVSRGITAAAWLLLLAALGAAFSAQRRVRPDSPGEAASLPLWLLLGGLACTALSLLF